MPKPPPPSDPTPPAKKPAGASEDQPTTRGGGTRYAGPGDAPTTYATSQGAAIGVRVGCGDRPDLALLELGRLEGIEAANLCTAGDAYYEGMLECIGAFRAIDELTRRFRGGLNLASVPLRNDLCDYMRQEPLRVPRAIRDPVLSLFGDETLERLLLRLSDSVIALDLSVRPGSVAVAAAAVPQEAARTDLITSIEDLELFCDAKGGGGVCYVTNEVGRQLTEIVQVLDNPELRVHVPDNDVDDFFSVIAGLLRNVKDLPTDRELRQLARKGSFGRRIIRAIAAQIDGVDAGVGTAPTTVRGRDASRGSFSDADLDTIGALVYEWRAAARGAYIDRARDACDSRTDERTADEDRVKMIRLRHRA